jgi:tetratricopeptide (TPR) repeat protein
LLILGRVLSPQNLLAESNTHKTEANLLFASGKYNGALAKYDQAVAVCPAYLDYELAVLKSNIAACQLKLEAWKDALSSATAALEGLGRIDAAEKEAKGANGARDSKGEEPDNDDDDDVEEEIISSGAVKAGPALTKEADAAEVAARKRREDIMRIRAKALMRRARARGELGGWANLEGALEDYKTLSAMTNLGPADKKIVQTQLGSLPPLVKTAQEKETAEMWGKLKEVCIEPHFRPSTSFCPMTALPSTKTARRAC